MYPLLYLIILIPLFDAFMSWLSSSDNQAFLVEFVSSFFIPLESVLHSSHKLLINWYLYPPTYHSNFYCIRLVQCARNRVMFYVKKGTPTSTCYNFVKSWEMLLRHTVFHVCAFWYFHRHPPWSARRVNWNMASIKPNSQLLIVAHTVAGGRVNI